MLHLLVDFNGNNYLMFISSECSVVTYAAIGKKKNAEIHIHN
jgi:hypothetical protein